MLLPLGGGSGVSGACIVAKAVDPSIQVVAVQSEAASAAYLSWKQGELVEAPVETFAEGVATKLGYELPQRIMAELLDDFLLVSDDDSQRRRHSSRNRPAGGESSYLGRTGGSDGTGRGGQARRAAAGQEGIRYSYRSQHHCGSPGRGP